MKDKKQLVIGITGASGAVYAIRLLELLKAHPLVETHLIISQAAKQTISAETNYSLSQVRELADHDYDVRDIGAAVSSGSFRISGMVVLPCSIKTLSPRVCEKPLCRTHFHYAWASTACQFRAS